METLAQETGDLDVLIAVKSRNLSHAYAYLQVAETLAAGSRHDEALEWAERGVKAFPERTDSRLREFLADEYHRRGRHDDAMNLIWAAYSEAPHVEQYQHLIRRLMCSTCGRPVASGSVMGSKFASSNSRPICFAASRLKHPVQSFSDFDMLPQ